jgi:hypothetical protein
MEIGDYLNGELIYNKVIKAPTNLRVQNPVVIKQ